MKNILICTPSYDGKVTADYMSSIIDYITNTNFNISYTMLQEDSLVTRSRNSLFSIFYNNIKNNNLTHLMFQDSDIYMKSSGLERMLDFNIDVIGQACPIKSNASIYGISCAVSGVYEEVEKYLYKCKYIGTGILILSKKVVEDLVQYCEDNNKWYWDSNLNMKVYDIFKTGVDDDKIYYSEDWYLCKLLNTLGYDIHVDSGAYVSHKTYIRNILPINKEAINRKFNNRLKNEDILKYWTTNDWLPTYKEIFSNDSFNEIKDNAYE